MKRSMQHTQKIRMDEEVEDDEEFDDNCFHVNENSILFYTPVSTRSCVELLKALRAIKEAKHGYAEVHIHSPGGDLMPCLAAYDAMRRLQDDSFYIHAIIEGCAASAASILALAAEYISMGSNAFFLIHQLSTGFVWGKLRDLSDEMNNSTKFEAAIRDIYLSRTNISNKQLTEMFSKEMYLTSKDCLKMGIVDELF